MTEIDRLVRQADGLMGSGRYSEAGAAYWQAWSDLNQDPAQMEAFGAQFLFWLLMSGMEALFCSDNIGQCFQVGRLAYETFEGSQIIPVVGNPFFHLRIGQCKHLLDAPDDRGRSGPGTALDDLSRALIGAGIEIFQDEDPAYLSAVTASLKPPEPYNDWEDSRGRYTGQTREMLEGSRGYLRLLFIHRNLLPA